MNQQICWICKIVNYMCAFSGRTLQVLSCNLPRSDSDQGSASLIFVLVGGAFTRLYKHTCGRARRCAQCPNKSLLELANAWPVRLLVVALLPSFLPAVRFSPTSRCSPSSNPGAWSMLDVHLIWKPTGQSLSNCRCKLAGTNKEADAEATPRANQKQRQKQKEEE